MRRKVSKILIILFVAMLILPMQMIQVLAIGIGDSPYLERGDLGFYSVQYMNSSTGNWTYITYSRTWYTDENGTKRIAYCVNPDLKGIGYISGEVEGYNIDLKETLSDARLWRVYRHGYPYVTPEDLGVETEDDAYLATKQASYCIIKGTRLEDVYKYYRAGQVSIEGESLEEIQRRGQKVVDAIYHLVDIGYNGTETPIYNDLININKSGEFAQDSNREYYSQKYTITSSTSISGYIIEDIEGFPEGSYVASINGKSKTTFAEGEQFKIMIPKESIKDNIEGRINIKGQCQNYPIYYGEARDGKSQNYVITLDSYSEATESTTLNVNAYKSAINIIKTDKETGEKLSGVKYSIKYEDGTNIGTFVTDENGKISVNNILQGKVIITELETQEDYILNEEPIEIDLEYNSTQDLKLTNAHKKGQIEIFKTSKDNNPISGLKSGEPIKGVEYGVYDLDGNYITTLITDENGYAISEKLDNKTYKIKEEKSGEWYILDKEEYTAEIVNDGDIITLKFTNESEKPSVEIEKTGIIETTANEEIRYDFNIKNTGNVSLDNFTWYDYLPTDYVRISKIVTGTYNQDLNYSIYYKTNKNDYQLLEENLNTQTNNYIDLSSLKLLEDEYITEIKADFGTVDVGFESIDSPYIFVKVNSNVKNDDKFTNKTRAEGLDKTYMVWDEDDHTTKIYEKELTVKKLPRTGY